MGQGQLSLSRNIRRLVSVFMWAAMPVSLVSSSPIEEPEQRSLTTAWQDANNLCLHGCPTGAAATNKIVDHKIFVLSNNGKTKFADWVAYAVTKETIGKSGDRVWRRDDDLPKTETLMPSEYKGASKRGYERGHQAALANLSATKDWHKTNKLSNITPQQKNLNEGAWKRLERAERNLVVYQGLKVHSVTGPLYERPMPKLPQARADHTVPSGYWKVVMVERGGRVEAAAFIMDQKLAINDNYCDQTVTLTVVETRSRLQLLPNLPSVQKQQVQQAAPRLLQDLGCK